MNPCDVLGSLRKSQLQSRARASKTTNQLVLLSTETAFSMNVLLTKFPADLSRHFLHKGKQLHSWS